MVKDYYNPNNANNENLRNREECSRKAKNNKTSLHQSFGL